MNFSSEYFQKHFNKIDKIEERVSNLEGKIEILYKEGENLGENRKKISNQKDEKK